MNKQEKVWEANIRVIIYVLLLIFPLVMLPNIRGVTLPKYVVAQTAAFLLAAMLLWKEIKANRNQINWFKKYPFLIPLIIILLYELISALVSPYRLFGIWEWQRRVSGYLLFFVIINIIRTKKSFNTALLFMIVSSTLTALYGIGQILKIDVTGWSRPFTTGIFSTFGHPNLYAAFLELNLFACLGLLWLKRNSENRIFYAGNILLLLGALVLTKSWGAAVGILTGIAFLVFSFIVSGLLKKAGFNKKILVAGLIIIAGLTVTAGVKFGPRILSANMFRVKTWEGASRMFLDKPVTGHGLGTFFILFPKYRDDQYLRRFRHAENLLHAHNEYLELLAEEGVIGFFLFVFVLAAIGKRFIEYFRSGESAYYKELSLFLSAGLIAFLAHNAVSVNMRWSGPYVSFWMFLGLTYGAFYLSDYSNLSTQKRKNRKRQTGRSKDRGSGLSVHKQIAGLLAFVFIALSIYAAATGIRRIQSSYHYQRAIPFLAKTPYASEELTKAVKLDASNIAAEYDLAYHYNTLNNGEMAVKTYLSVISKNPYYQRVYRNLGIAYWNMGQLKKALESIEKALEYNDNEFGRYHRASLYQSLGETEKAVEAYLHFLDMSLKFIAFHDRIAREAPEGFQQIVPHEYDDILLWTNQALKALKDIYLEKDNLSKPAAIFDRLMQEYPYNDEIIFYKGSLFQDTGEYEKAIEIYEKGLQKFPDNTRLLNSKGECFYRLDRIDEALMTWKKSLKIDPKQIIIKGRIQDVQAEKSNAGTKSDAAENDEEKKEYTLTKRAYYA